MDNSKRQSGSVLIEAMVGLMLIIVSFGGIIGLISRGLQMNSETANKFIATHLAAEGVEIVKGSLDMKWDNVLAGAYELDVSCKQFQVDVTCKSIGGQNSRSVRSLSISSEGVYSYDVGVSETPFIRTVVVNIPDSKTVTVNSIVQWTSRGVTQSVQVSDTFKKWRKDQNE